MRGVLLQAGGPIGTITVVSTVLVALFVSPSAAGVLLVTASVVAAAVVLVGALPPGSRGRSFSPGPPRAAWPPEVGTSHEPASAVAERHDPAVATRYRPLHAYLQHQHGANVVLTFEQIESLLGFALPAPASTEQAWWTAQATPLADHTGAWTGAGRTAAPNLQTRMVLFAHGDAVAVASGV